MLVPWAVARSGGREGNHRQREGKEGRARLSLPSYRLGQDRTALRGRMSDFVAQRRLFLRQFLQQHLRGLVFDLPVLVGLQRAFEGLLGRGGVAGEPGLVTDIEIGHA